MSNDLTIVMYHYVRQLEQTRYPNIKARRTDEFKSQVAYLQKNYTPVTMAEVVHCVRTGDQLPPKAVLLTFDDGYIEHYSSCFPILFDAGIEGSFFPPVSSVVGGELLDVNRLHFVLSVTEASALAMEIDKAVSTHRDTYDLHTVDTYRAEWAKPNRFDTADTIYVKRMLQTALPDELRTKIAKDLFSKYVSIDETTFAAELYMTEAQCRLMQSSGMYIGSHGETHRWLNRISKTDQRQEVEGSLEFLRKIGSPVDDFWVMCFPYGGWNESLLSVLQEYKCSLGLTTEVRAANLLEDEPLTLPRYDTNDIPLS